MLWDRAIFRCLGNLTTLVLFAIYVNQVVKVTIYIFGATPFSTSNKVGFIKKVYDRFEWDFTWGICFDAMACSCEGSMLDWSWKKSKITNVRSPWKKEKKIPSYNIVKYHILQTILNIKTTWNSLWSEM